MYRDFGNGDIYAIRDGRKAKIILGMDGVHAEDAQTDRDGAARSPREIPRPLHQPRGDSQDDARSETAHL